MTLYTPTGNSDTIKSSSDEIKNINISTDINLGISLLNVSELSLKIYKTKN